MIKPRFTLSDLERAHDEWSANCGPGALAAICGLTLDEVRHTFEANGFDTKHYTNPTMMFGVLRKIGVRWILMSTQEWPRWGLCRIQWEGPWTQPGVPIRARYRYTHWVGAATDPGRGVGIFDINVLSNGSGWCSLDDWSTHVAPVLAKDHDKRATGGWHITHAIEVSR